MEPIGDKVEVVLDTANTPHSSHTNRELNLHVSGLLKGKHFPRFHVTHSEFDHFKNHIVNKRVKWSVAPDPPMQRDPPISFIDRLHRTVEKLTQIRDNAPVEIEGTWIENANSVGGKKRSGKKRSGKKRSGKKSRKSHKRSGKKRSGKSRRH
jgi:hypothetical protein